MGWVEPDVRWPIPNPNPHPHPHPHPHPNPKQDPFQHWDRSFDFQGLSDIRSTNVTTGRHHEITCLRPWMENMYEHGRRSIYPCQSTGLWYARSTPPTHAFLQG